jgi:aspartyl protease family protein
VRQLVLWLIAGFAVYVLVNRSFMTPHQAPGAKPAPPPAMAAAAPQRQSAALVTNSLILRAAQDGYVYADTEIDGTPMRMAIDTGASLVSLTEADAARAGVAGSLNYSMAIATGNGTVYGAPVTLRAIRIGQLEIGDVRAVVMQHLSLSLLGQSFLSRLASYHMQDGVMTLSWQ